MQTIADDLGIVNAYALRLAGKYGFTIHYGKRNFASLSGLGVGKD